MNLKTLLTLLILFLSTCAGYAYTPSEASDRLAEKLLKPDSQLFFVNAINHNNTEVVKLYIDAQQVDINERFCGCPPLLLAVMNNAPQSAMLLLKAGADPTKTSSDGGKPLFYAVKKGYTEVVREILKNPDIDIKRTRQLFRLPLITTARINKYTEIERMLTEYKTQYEEREKIYAQIREQQQMQSKEDIPSKEAIPSDTDPYTTEDI